MHVNVCKSSMPQPRFIISGYQTIHARCYARHIKHVNVTHSFTYMRHWSGTNVILYPLSHSWLILNKLCFNPFTKSIFSMITLLFLHITNSKYLASDIVTICHISCRFPFDINQLRWISCHMLWASTVQIPHQLTGCQADLQNRLELRHWYPVKFGSSSVRCAFGHPPS